MSKKLTIVTLVIAVLALGLSCFCLFNTLKPAEQTKKDVQYVLYLGTNDKDTNEPVFPFDEAKSKAEEILIKHFGGFTIQEANGGWLDGETLYRENTIVIYLSDTTLDKIHAVSDEMIKVFNQSSVLIQTNETTTEFYSGK